MGNVHIYIECYLPLTLGSVGQLDDSGLNTRLHLLSCIII
jgi:hypothetical protein